MATEEHLRKRILRLINHHGISQKVLAGHMDVSESWLSRWLRREKGVRAMTVTAMDGLDRYIQDLQRTLDGDLPAVTVKHPQKREQPKGGQAGLT